MRKPRRAVVLLMTLAMIMLASLAMTRLANRSMAIVRRGVMAQQELQQRWCEKSCRMTLLQRADELFAKQEEQASLRGVGWPHARTVELQLSLGGQTTSVLLRDEQASVNLNRLHQQQPAQLPTIVAQSALQSQAPIRLRPLDTSRPEHAVAFVSWGQVVDLGRIDRRQSLQQTLAPINETLTCWGKPQLNLRRANDEAIRLAVRPYLDAVETEELLKYRRGFDGDLQTLWQLLEIHRTTQLQLNRVVGIESKCFSLWLTRPTGGHQQSTLMVTQSGNGGVQSDWTWRW